MHTTCKHNTHTAGANITELCPAGRREAARLGFLTAFTSIWLCTSGHGPHGLGPPHPWPAPRQFCEKELLLSLGSLQPQPQPSPARRVGVCRDMLVVTTTFFLEMPGPWPAPRRLNGELWMQQKPPEFLSPLLRSDACEPKAGAKGPWKTLMRWLTLQPFKQGDSEIW